MESGQSCENLSRPFERARRNNHPKQRDFGMEQPTILLILLAMGCKLHG